MRMRYLGDSYDIVKQSMLRWLDVFGAWTVHPMFTEATTADEVNTFQFLLNAKVISKEVLTLESNRVKFFECCKSAQNLFLDPDTGLRFRTTRGRRAPEYLFSNELIEIINGRESFLTMIFDQSVGRGAERLHLTRKLSSLKHQGIEGFAYISHACFLVLSRSSAKVVQAKQHLLEQSGLPASRFESSI
jgi:hypothetical protein